MVPKYFLNDCFKTPRNRTHAEVCIIQDLLDSWYDELERNPDKLAYFILEVADRAFESGQTVQSKRVLELEEGIRACANAWDDGITTPYDVYTRLKSLIDERGTDD